MSPSVHQQTIKILMYVKPGQGQSYVGGNPLSWRDPKGLFGIAAVPEAVIIGALGCYFTPGCRQAVAEGARGLTKALDNVLNNESAKPKPDREQKPEGCPVGTKPIDKDRRLNRGKIHGIKDQINADPRDWVGISPDGRIWTNEGGQAVDNGQFEDYLP
jgi:hypothetical protein